MYGVYILHICSLDIKVYKGNGVYILHISINYMVVLWKHQKVKELICLYPYRIMRKYKPALLKKVFLYPFLNT